MPLRTCLRAALRLKYLASKVILGDRIQGVEWQVPLRSIDAIDTGSTQNVKGCLRLQQRHPRAASFRGR